jgi:ectoine hydroxylase-related dioxygenase (phytanoyl-CoA dioxygenase family)
MSIQLEKQENKSGDQTAAPQGFGRVAESPAPSFNPITQTGDAIRYFEKNGFVVLAPCLSAGELKELNNFYDRTQAELPDVWGLGERRKPHHRNQGLIFSQPLLDHPELDSYTQHPVTYPIVSELLGGEEHTRFSEFNFREAPENGGFGTMNFHHDATVEDRFLRQPYLPCDYLCAIHYLTDVDATTPAFCVVPGSNQFETLQESYETFGDDYIELPIHGEAGSCVLYDTAIFHTRLDGDGVKRRRTWHQYYARGGWIKSALPTTNRYIRAPSPTLTDWNLFPERLARHPDLAKRRFFSHWNTAQGEWAASEFSDDVRFAMPKGNS